MKSFIVLIAIVCIVGVYSHPHHEGHDHHDHDSHEHHDHDSHEHHNHDGHDHHDHDHKHEGHDHHGHDHHGHDPHSKLTDEQKAKIHADVDACAEESKVDPKLFKDMKEGKPFTPTRELDCFAACIFKKNGMMDADGKVVEKPTDSDKAKDCKKLSGDDVCQTAGKIMGCFYENKLIPKIGH